MAEDHLLRVKQFTISNEFFDKGYAAGSGPCDCTSLCCKGGVWMDAGDHKRIMAQQELVKLEMDETQITDQNQWFEDKVVDDSDFPSGKAVGTEVINDKCAFLDKLGRCSVQLAAVSAGLHKWTWKPMYCVLFPIEVSDNVVGFDPMLQNDQKCCTVSSVFDTPLFVACREELIHLLGEDGYSIMEKHYAGLKNISAESIQG